MMAGKIDESTMNKLPPEFVQFTDLFETQPSSVQIVFQYCLCLLMVEAGKMQLVGTIPGESGATYIFETMAGGRFSVVKPPISPEIEADLLQELRELLAEDELPF